MRTKRSLMLVAVLLAGVLQACGGGGGDEPQQPMAIEATAPNRPDLLPYGTADSGPDISVRADNSKILDLERRAHDAALGRVWIRDTYVNYFVVNGVGSYYATGTTKAPGLDKAAPWNDGIYVWKAPSLDGPWTLLDTTTIRPTAVKGKVWSPQFINENAPGKVVVAPWQQYIDGLDPATRKGEVWAPELHYVKGKWYIVACMGDDSRKIGSFVLVSDGGPEGPYRNIAGSSTKPLGDPVRATEPNHYHIDGGLFNNGGDNVFLVLHNNLYAKFKPDMSDLIVPTGLPLFDQTEYSPEPYLEGATVFKHQNKYFLMHAAWSLKKSVDGIDTFSYLGNSGGTKWQYDAIVAVSDTFAGPYTKRYTAGVGIGHNNFFRDANGTVWATFFRNPAAGYWADPGRIGDAAVPGIVRMEFTTGNRLYIERR